MKDRNADIVTSDLSEFGHKELCDLRDLLTAYLDKNQTHFLGSGVKPCFNRNSGYVFLTDEDYNVAMEANGKLLDWFSSPYNGVEGFFEDIKPEYESMHPDDQEWLQNIAEELGEELPELKETP